MSIYNELEIQDSQRTKNPESKLFNKMKVLYPNLTKSDFEDELNREGFENLNQRIKINLESQNELKVKYGGDGKGLLRRYNELDNQGLLVRTPTKRNKKLWKEILDTMETEGSQYE